MDAEDRAPRWAGLPALSEVRIDAPRYREGDVPGAPAGGSASSLLAALPAPHVRGHPAQRGRAHPVRPEAATARQHQHDRGHLRPLAPAARPPRGHAAARPAGRSEAKWQQVATKTDLSKRKESGKHTLR